MPTSDLRSPIPSPRPFQPAVPAYAKEVITTLLHPLGFDDGQLTYRFQGRDFRLTDVHGKIVHEILA